MLCKKFVKHDKFQFTFNCFDSYSFHLRLGTQNSLKTKPRVQTDQYFP